MNLEKIVLELMSRIQVLEEEVEELKKCSNSYQVVNNEDKQEDEEVKGVVGDLLDLSDVLSFLEEKKETKLYKYNMTEYSYRDLVLAVVKDVLSEKMTIDDALDLFNDDLQGKYGVIKRVDDVKKNHTENCYFTENRNVIHLKDGDIYVCSQWGQYNIERFVDHCVKRLNVKIEKI